MFETVYDNLMCDKLRIATLFTGAVMTTNLTVSGAYCLYEYGCNIYMWEFM